MRPSESRLFQRSRVIDKSCSTSPRKRPSVVAISGSRAAACTLLGACPSSTFASESTERCSGASTSFSTFRLRSLATASSNHRCASATDVRTVSHVAISAALGSRVQLAWKYQNVLAAEPITSASATANSAPIASGLRRTKRSTR